jgi:hypothetical protein
VWNCRTFTFQSSTGACVMISTGTKGTTGGLPDFTSGTCDKGSQPQINALNVRVGSVSVPTFGAPMPNCRTIFFDSPLPAALRDSVVVVTTISHPGATSAHAPIASWTTQTNHQGFTVCVGDFLVQQGRSRAYRINYVATVSSKVGGAGSARQR